VPVLTPTLARKAGRPLTLTASGPGHPPSHLVLPPVRSNVFVAVPTIPTKEMTSVTKEEASSKNLDAKTLVAAAGGLPAVYEFRQGATVITVREQLVDGKTSLAALLAAKRASQQDEAAIAAQAPPALALVPSSSLAAQAPSVRALALSPSPASSVATRESPPGTADPRAVVVERLQQLRARHAQERLAQRELHVGILEAVALAEVRRGAAACTIDAALQPAVAELDGREAELVRRQAAQLAVYEAELCAWSDTV